MNCKIGSSQAESSVKSLEMEQGLEHSTSQGTCPGGGLDRATPRYKGDESLGMWKWMYHVAWPPCQQPVLDYFSVPAKAWLSQTVAKRWRFFPHPSACLCVSNWHELPHSAAAVCAVTCQLYPLRPLRAWSGSPAESSSSGCSS